MDGNQGIGRLRDWEIGLVSQSLSLLVSIFRAILFRIRPCLSASQA